MKIATIFESPSTKKDDGWTYQDLYKKLDGILDNFCKRNAIQFKKEEGKSSIITYNNVPIRYRLYRSNKFGRYFISFLPDNRWKYPIQPNKTRELIPAIKATIELFNMLPNEIDVGLLFKKSSSIGEIDITDWTFGTNPDIGQSKLSGIEKFGQYNAIGNELLKRNTGAVNKIPVFFIDGASSEKSRFELIKKEILPLFSKSPVVFDDMDNVRELATSRFQNKDIFIFFFGADEKIDKVYKEYKKYFIEKEIPSQFISSSKAAGNNILPFGKANLIIEILKKTNKEPIFLDSRCASNVDGFLYLSDINETDKDKFFGISINLSGDGITEDLIEIYKNIGYTKECMKRPDGSIRELDRIYFEEKDLNTLADRIVKLSSHLKDKNIYIFVSKLWRDKDVELICKILEKEKIYVKKFIYIAEKANRFIFSSVLDEPPNLYIHPYIIWDSQSASIMTNSKIQFYGSVFPLYLEALKPDKDAINLSDLETILWLVKKRIYRIANFFSLRSPELLSLLDQFKQLPIGEVEQLRISLGFLI